MRHRIFSFILEFMLQNGKKVQVIYHTSLPVIFRAPKYAESLWKVAEKKKVKVHLNSDLIEIKPGRKEAVFQNLSKPEEKIVQDVSDYFLNTVKLRYL